MRWTEVGQGQGHGLSFGKFCVHRAAAAASQAQWDPLVHTHQLIQANSQMKRVEAKSLTPIFNTAE